MFLVEDLKKKEMLLLFLIIHSDHIAQKLTQSLGDLRSEHVSHRPTLAFVTVPQAVHAAWQWAGVREEKRTQ